MALLAFFFHPSTLRGHAAAAAPENEDQAAPALPASTEDVSGVAIPEAEQPASPARQLLVVPRLAVATVAMPLRGGLTVYEQHHVRERLLDLFFNDARTFGVYPTVAFETSLTPAAGLRLVHKDLFGTGGRLRIGGDYGGESRYRLEAGVTSPAFARDILRTRVTGGWLRQPSAFFFGIGDQDLSPSDSAPGAIAARGPFAASSRFSQQVAHAELAVEVNPDGPLFGAVSSAYFTRTFIDTPEPALGEAPRLGRTDVRFDTSTLTGWNEGTKIVYSEAQLGWNSLTAASTYVSAAAPSSGTKAVAFGGLARGVGGAEVAYARYGLDGFRYFDLFGGDRVLIVRGRLEGVAGRDDQIPFTDLPRLGGPVLLRGFARDRFRDRVAMMAVVEYRYPIIRQVGGFLFIDAGRVLPDLAEAGRAVLAPQLLRVGGGGGLELLQGEIFRMRAQVAGSQEGFFFQVALEPLYKLPTHHHRI